MKMPRLAATLLLLLLFPISLEAQVAPAPAAGDGWTPAFTTPEELKLGIKGTAVLENGLLRVKGRLTLPQPKTAERR